MNYTQSLKQNNQFGQRPRGHVQPSTSIIQSQYRTPNPQTTHHQRESYSQRLTAPRHYASHAGQPMAPAAQQQQLQNQLQNQHQHQQHEHQLSRAHHHQLQNQHQHAAARVEQDSIQNSQQASVAVANPASHPHNNANNTASPSAEEAMSSAQMQNMPSKMTINDEPNGALDTKQDIVQEPKQAASSEPHAPDADAVVHDADQHSVMSGTTPKKKPFSSSNSSNSKIFFGTRYEVKCDETLAFYEGYVYDYDEEQKKLKVAYAWKTDQSVPAHYVRPVAPRVDPTWKPKQGEHVECQAKAEESEPYGWWDCVIKTVRDNLFLITYEGWDNHHEVLQHNMLRPYNDQEPFEDDGIIRDLLKISDERIIEFKSTGDMSCAVDKGDAMESKAQRSMSQLQHIARQTKLIHVNFEPESEQLILIGRKQAVQDAKMLIQFVWLSDLYRSKEETVKRDQRTFEKEFNELNKCVKVRFEFNIALTRYVIGNKGDNIMRAKKVAGVRHINVRGVDQDTTECLILATDQASADEARDILEMQEDFEMVPASVKKELIGKDGANVRRLEERSQVIKICTLDHLKYIRRDSSRGYYNEEYDEQQQQQQQNGMIKLVIIGPKEKVPFAKMLIASDVASIEQKRKFIERQLIAKQEMSKSNDMQGPSNHNHRKRKRLSDSALSESFADAPCPKKRRISVNPQTPVTSTTSSSTHNIHKPQILPPDSSSDSGRLSDIPPTSDSKLPTTTTVVTTTTTVVTTTTKLPPSPPISAVSPPTAAETKNEVEKKKPRWTKNEVDALLKGFEQYKDIAKQGLWNMIMNNPTYASVMYRRNPKSLSSKLWHLASVDDPKLMAISGAAEWISANKKKTKNKNEM